MEQEQRRLFPGDGILIRGDDEDAARALWAYAKNIAESSLEQLKESGWFEEVED